MKKEVLAHVYIDIEEADLKFNAVCEAYTNLRRAIIEFEEAVEKNVVPSIVIKK